MPYYMDRHDIEGATPADIAAAHTEDVSVQERYGVEYVTYWFDYARHMRSVLPVREAIKAGVGSEVKVGEISALRSNPEPVR